MISSNGIVSTDTTSLASYYAKQFPINNLDPSSHVDYNVNNTTTTCLNIPPTSFPDPTAPIEIIDITKNLQKNKSPGWERINNIALEHLPLNIIFLLTSLYNF